MLLHHGGDAPLPPYTFSNRGYKSNILEIFNLLGLGLFFYSIFSALMPFIVVKIELYHGGGGLTIPVIVCYCTCISLEGICVVEIEFCHGSDLFLVSLTEP